MENNYSYDEIKENLRSIHSNISEAYDKYRNDGSKVDIMAVTKTVPAEVVNYVFDFGLDLLGENRVQEFQSKAESYDSKAKVHFIGHLQTNKVKYIINSVEMIQSVDSIKLAQEINRLAVNNGKIMDILCEVNIGGEDSKSGIAPENLRELIEQTADLEGVRVRGLMTIPPPCESDVFLGRMQELFHKISDYNISGVSMDVLSMGMTNDYARAVKYGSTLVRIGTGLFGARNYKV
ncbi:MAG: YggS family pyridoxal phosphate-dependent enzyme [Ruminococcus flavefaciens]|nr:YggS family pyridoxal phosphate-dependent enzyme [Ruminococcus flavefaciens]MCM1360592.1 YggS family pyridoxal phosphate-dependent enzyme [Clostridiales bacterium]MCM1435224.1 YggS family pyridoxal phosphate-dependent enzyme [Ruminococcus flavefaciens]